MTPHDDDALREDGAPGPHRRPEDPPARGRPRTACPLLARVGAAVAVSVVAAGSAEGQDLPAGFGELPPATPWQQGVDYRIEARLDEADEVLHGRARLRYRNDSPRTLDEFYLHLHLNAFRPNSAWARADLERGITTFQELGPEEHGFERIREMRVDGEPVELFYPFAPDSTVVGLRLPGPMGPGGSIVLDYAWDARPSSVPRRQGRRGRQYDFAQWYPRVVVYDEEGWRIHPLYRQGEFFGEFATYDVTLEVASDQVVGATGVPVEGDPGWEAAAAPGTGPVAYQRAWYGTTSGRPCVERGGERRCGDDGRRVRAAEPLGLLSGAPSGGRKRIRWYAEDVHHFAWATSPDFIYEQGVWDDVVIHVLYRPGDEETWGGGVAVRRTAVALEWLDGVFGDYAYPHVTNLHRIEGGGTEFPMVVMDGSASQGLILHEVGHIYAHGILANNEWLEGWLDEGLSSFQTAWFRERAGAGDEVWRSDRLQVLERAVRGEEQPVVLPAEEYRSYSLYGDMVYDKGALVFLLLREMVGEEAFREILRTYYARYALERVDSETFQATAELVTGRELDWFFDQWLRETGVVDYALREVERTSDRRSYRTTFVVERVGEMVMPVPVRIEGPDGAVLEMRLDPVEERRDVEVRTDFPPRRIRIDPDGDILDWNPANGAWSAGLLSPAREWRLANPLEPVAPGWPEIPTELFPLAWYNDAGGVVIGGQLRSAQLGLADRWLVRVGLPAVEVGGTGDRGDHFDPGSVHLRLTEPIVGGRPRFGAALEAFVGEGRWLVRGHRGAGTGAGGPAIPLVDSARVFGSVHGVYEGAYLVPGRWSPDVDVAVEVGAGGSAPRIGGMPAELDLEASVGVASGGRVWLRGSARAAADRPFASGALVRGRAFVGGAVGRSGDDAGGWSGDRVPRERRFFLAGAGPLETLANPWIRSAGAPFDDEGRAPGGGGLPGFHPGVALPWVAAAGVEIGAPPLAIEVGGEVLLRPVAFAGLAVGRASPGGVAAAPGGTRGFYSAGAGLELGLGDAPAAIRLDLPLLLSDPEAGFDPSPDRLDLRLGVTFPTR